MRRRDFIAGITGSAAAWPLTVGAQQPGGTRRIGLLTPLAAGDAEGQSRLAVFLRELQQLGWTDGQNLQIEYRWSAGNPDEMRKLAGELAALKLEVIFSSGIAAVAPLLQTTRSTPIVFALIPDPVGAGYVESLARPGGNATGFMNYEYGLSGKWLALLKEIMPGVKRAAVLRDPNISSGIGQFAAIQSVAPSLGIEVIPVNVRDAFEIERALAVFARFPNGGMVTTGRMAVIHRDLIVALAARLNRPRSIGTAR